MPAVPSMWNTTIRLTITVIVLSVDGRLKTAFNQATLWQRWLVSLWEASSCLSAADVPFGTQTNKKLSLPGRLCPPIQLLPFRAFGFLSFTAPVTLSKMNRKITNQRHDYNMGMHPPTPIKPPGWEPPVGMFTVWRVNSLILSGMFPLGGAV